MVGGDDFERMLTVDIVDIGEAVFSVDPGQRIVAWNAAAERLFGYAKDEVVGHHCHEVLACVERPVALCRAYCAQFGKPEHRPLAPVDITVRTRQGASRELAMSTVMARTATGRPRIVHILRASTAEDDMHTPSSAWLRAAGRAAQSDDSADDLAPEPHLTPREMEALRLLASGCSTLEIAASLGVSRITARNHVTKVMDKLQVRTRLQAVVAASRRGLL